MFGWKKRSPARSGVIGPVPWDDDTCRKIAGTDRFDVTVTSVTRRVLSGKTQEEIISTPRPLSFEAHGIMSYPKYITVQFEFSYRVDGSFGAFSYDILDRIGGLDRDVKVPSMHVSLWDPKIAGEMYEAHLCALMIGRRNSFVRLWKRKGDGSMTARDKEQGYSYESRYEILGVTTWSELEAPGLPEWALPTAHENFSIRDLPESTFRTPID